MGNGTVTGAYVQIGKLVHFRLKVVFGSTTSVGGSIDFTLPVSGNTAQAATSGEAVVIGMVKYNDVGGSITVGQVEMNSLGTKGNLIVFNASTTYLTRSALSSTVPHNWANTDEILIAGSYEAA